MPWLFLSLAVFSGASASTAAQGAKTMIWSSTGEPVKFESLFDKASVVFFEDKDATEINAALKRDLFARGKALNLLEKVRVVAVANLADFNWFPAKQFASAGLRAAEKKAKIPVFADWKGQLMKAPWNLPRKGSTVLVVAPGGELLLKMTGRADSEFADKILSAITPYLEEGSETP